MKIKMVLSAALFVAVCAQAAVVYNGDLSTAVEMENDFNSNFGFYLDTVTKDVMYVSKKEKDSTVDANAWVWGTTRAFEYSATGGNPDGGFTDDKTATDHNAKARSVLQFAEDSKATIGSITIKLDVFLEDNTASDTLFFNIELYAWNAADTGPQLSCGGSTAGGADYKVTALGDAVTLLDNIVLSSETIPASTWTTVSLGAVDLGTGYDYYAWRIGAVGQNNEDNYAFDNLRISEPMTMGLLSMVRR